MTDEKRLKLIPNYKIWLSNEHGDYIVGSGGAALLRAIRKHKHLGKAGEELGVSYRKAWNMLKKIKINIGTNPVHTYRGGSGGGGGMELSETGKILLETFDKYAETIKKALTDFKSSIPDPNSESRLG